MRLAAAQATAGESACERGLKVTAVAKARPSVRMTQARAHTPVHANCVLHIQSSARLHVRMTTPPYGAGRPPSTTSCEQMREQLSAGTPVCLWCVSVVCTSDLRV